MYVLCLFLACGINVHAKGKHRLYLKLIEAYTQKTLPGRQEGRPPITGYHFIIIWEGDKSPETFFWRGDGGWLSCKMQKAHKFINRSAARPGGIDYITQGVAGGDIHKGDTLELSPVTGGKFPIPADIPADAKNTLFFTTGGSGWLAYPVNKITKKPDIAMP